MPPQRDTYRLLLLFLREVSSPSSQLHSGSPPLSCREEKNSVCITVLVHDRVGAKCHQKALPASPTGPRAHTAATWLLPPATSGCSKVRGAKLLSPPPREPASPCLSHGTPSPQWTPHRWWPGFPSSADSSTSCKDTHIPLPEASIPAGLGTQKKLRVPRRGSARTEPHHGSFGEHPGVPLPDHHPGVAWARWARWQHLGGAARLGCHQCSL